MKAIKKSKDAAAHCQAQPAQERRLLTFLYFKCTEDYGAHRKAKHSKLS
jgi:hypothetical protein